MRVWCECVPASSLVAQQSVADGLPPPPGWRFWGHALAPGMSPTPRSAKYPVSHGCHHLRGGDFGGVLSLRACRRRPGRRNTRFRTAATAYRGGGNVRLRSSSPPSAEIALCGALVIVSAVGGGADAALRRGIISFIGPIGPIVIFDFSWCKDRVRRCRARADCDNFGDLT